MNLAQNKLCYLYKVAKKLKLNGFFHIISSSIYFSNNITLTQKPIDHNLAQSTSRYLYTATKKPRKPSIFFHFSHIFADDSEIWTRHFLPTPNSGKNRKVAKTATLLFSLSLYIVGSRQAALLSTSDTKSGPANNWARTVPVLLFGL